MKEITVEPLERRPSGTSPHVKTLAAMLEIARIDNKGDRIGSRERRKLIHRLPAILGGSPLDDWRTGDDSSRRPAAELLLTEAIESTSIIQEQVQRTVVAGADKMKIIRDIGCQWYNTSSNSLRVPLGEAQINAAVVSEAAEIKDRTQDYGFRDFPIIKYGVKPRISYEMMEDGLVDVVAEELFFAGAAIENKLNFDGIAEMVSHAGNVNAYVAGRTSATEGNGLLAAKATKAEIRADGFYADTFIMCSELEADIMSNVGIAYAANQGTNTVVASGKLPTTLYGMKTFVTDNQTAGTSWDYDADNDIGGIILEAKRGFGVAMRRDVTVKKFDDIVRELNTITVTMRSACNYLHANAVGKVVYESA